MKFFLGFRLFFFKFLFVLSFVWFIWTSKTEIQIYKFSIVDFYVPANTTRFLALVIIPLEILNFIRRPAYVLSQIYLAYLLTLKDWSRTSCMCMVNDEDGVDGLEPYFDFQRWQDDFHVRSVSRRLGILTVMEGLEYHHWAPFLHAYLDRMFRIWLPGELGVSMDIDRFYILSEEDKHQILGKIFWFRHLNHLLLPQLHWLYEQVMLGRRIFRRHLALNERPLECVVTLQEQDGNRLEHHSEGQSLWNGEGSVARAYLFRDFRFLTPQLNQMDASTLEELAEWRKALRPVLAQVPAAAAALDRKRELRLELERQAALNAALENDFPELVALVGGSF